MDPLFIVLILLLAAIIMFAINRPRMDGVGLLMLCLLPLSGVITLDEALMGFSDRSVILIALMFVVGEALVRTGIVHRVGDWITLKAGNNEIKLIVLLMTSVAFIGSIMSSTGVVAIFIPVVVRIASRSNIPASRLMMPLSMAALMSGMMTLVATPPNLIVHSELLRHGLEGFSFFAVTPFGLPLLVLCIIYMILMRPLLQRRQSEHVNPHRMRFNDLIDQYKLSAREMRLRILPGSPLIGQILSDLDLRANEGIHILAIERRNAFARKLVMPRAHTQLMAGDILLLDIEKIPDIIDRDQIFDTYQVKPLPLTNHYFADHSQQIGMAEAIIPASSPLIGKNLTEVQFRSRHDLSVVGIKHNNEAVLDNLAQYSFQIGDTLLLVGGWSAISRLQRTSSEVVMLDLPQESEDMAPAANRAPYALMAIGLMIVLMVSGIIPNVLAALIVCLLLGAMRCIDFNSAYRSIHWQSLILIVGMMPFSIALQKTGGVQIASDFLLGFAGGHSPRFILAALFAVTAILGLFISNTATAVLMAPVAIALAQGMGASPYPFAMTVALAASAAFMTPVSSPVNTLVLGPGNYRFIDFIKIGVPFTLITLVVAVMLIPILLPF